MVDERTRRNRKIMSPIIASGSLSLWHITRPRNPFNTKNSPTILIPASPISLLLPLLLQLFLPSADRDDAAYGRGRGRGFFLIELFFFPCTLPRAFSIHLQIPSLLPPSRLNGSFCFCFFRFIRRASEKFHADFHAWKKLATR